jgi:hypothetical protein
MPAPIKLSDVVDALEGLPTEGAAFANPATGEVFILAEEEIRSLDPDEPPDDEGDGLPDSLAELRAVWDTLVPLPDTFEIHEWEIMERFARTREDDDDEYRELASALRGKGAFRRFRAALDRLGLRDQWFAFRRRALEEIARDWAAENALTLVES